MNQGDEAMLEAFRAGQEYAARRIREMGGNPARPTRKQARVVAKELLNRAMLMRALVDPDASPPAAEGIMKDYDHIQRLKQQRDH